ncbi:MAG: SdpI family protein [Myxococcota bacterium]
MLWCLACALVGALMAVVAWPSLPESMAVHWGADGTPDRHMGRLVGVSMAPLAAVLAPGLVVVAALLSKRTEHVERSWPAISTIMVGVSAFLVGVQWLALQAAASPDETLDSRSVIVLTGLLWMVMGNAMPKLRSNGFAGVRTRWTLGSEKVWHVTHRAAGWTFAGSGLLTILAALTLPPVSVAWVAVVLLLSGAIAPNIYSYFVWKNLESSPTAGS